MQCWPPSWHQRSKRISRSYRLARCALTAVQFEVDVGIYKADQQRLETSTVSKIWEAMVINPLSENLESNFLDKLFERETEYAIYVLVFASEGGRIAQLCLTSSRISSRVASSTSSSSFVADFGLLIVDVGSLRRRNISGRRCHLDLSLLFFQVV